MDNGAAVRIEDRVLGRRRCSLGCLLVLGGTHGRNFSSYGRSVCIPTHPSFTLVSNSLITLQNVLSETTLKFEILIQLGFWSEKMLYTCVVFHENCEGYRSRKIVTENISKNKDFFKNLYRKFEKISFFSRFRSGILFVDKLFFFYLLKIKKVTII